MANKADKQSDKKLSKRVSDNPFLNRDAYSVAVGKHHKQNIKFDAEAINFANDAMEVMKRIKEYCRSQYNVDSVKNISSNFDLHGNKKQQEFFGKLAHTTSKQRKKIMAILNARSPKGSKNDSSNESRNSKSSATTSFGAKANKKANSVSSNSASNTDDFGHHNDDNNIPDFRAPR